MSQKKLKTAWMWLDGYETRGLAIDPEAGLLEWYDVVGCHCADEEFVRQNIESYRKDGAPPYVGPLPEDTAAEIEETLAQLSKEIAA